MTESCLENRYRLVSAGCRVFVSMIDADLAAGETFRSFILKSLPGIFPEADKMPCRLTAPLGRAFPVDLRYSRFAVPLQQCYTPIFQVYLFLQTRFPSPELFPFRAPPERSPAGGASLRLRSGNGGGAP